MRYDIYIYVIRQLKVNLVPTRPAKCWIIRQSLCRPKFWQEIFCYCSSNCAAQLIRVVLHLDISFNCWFKGIWVPFKFFWSLFRFYKECRTRRLRIRSLYRLRSWWIRRHGFKWYHNGRCTDSFEGVFGRCTLGIIFVNCWSTRISGVSGSGLMEFYCLYM